MSAFSGRLLELRQSQNLSQKKIAQEIGIDVRAYQRYEYGEREPQISIFFRIADFYGVGLEYLAGRTNTP